MTELVYDNRRVGEWVCERLGNEYLPQDSRAIGLARDGKLIAGVFYDQYNHRSIAMHVAAEGPHWLSRTFLRAVFGYPFLQLGVLKIVGLVDSANTVARRFDEKLGFVLEATIADAAPHGDLLIFTMRRNQCRWLGVRHG